MKLLFVLGSFFVLFAFMVIRYQFYTEKLKQRYTDEMNYGDVAASILFLLGVMLLMVSAIWWAVV